MSIGLIIPKWPRAKVIFFLIYFSPYGLLPKLTFEVHIFIAYISHHKDIKPVINFIYSSKILQILNSEILADQVRLGAKL